MVAVSHDRYFLNRVCTSILAFEGNGQLYSDVGNYDDYLTKRAAHAAEAARWQAQVANQKSAAAATPARGAAAARKLTYKETQELETAEARIQSAEENVARLETLLSRSDVLPDPGRPTGRPSKPNSRPRAKRLPASTPAGKNWNASVKADRQSFSPPGRFSDH